MNTRKQASELIGKIFDSAFLRAMTEPARIELVRQLALHGPTDVAGLASKVPQERSVVSRHLKILEDAGVVTVIRSGKHRIYSLDGTRLLAEIRSIADHAVALAPACCAPSEPAPVPISRLTSKTERHLGRK